jgi:hypothetical protein
VPHKLPKSNDRMTPVEASVAGAVVAYLLAAAWARASGSIDVSATLLGFPALFLALLAVVAVHIAVYMVLRRYLLRRRESAINSKAELFATLADFRTSLVRMSRWWHYVLSALTGLMFGFALARGLELFLV